TPIRREVRRFWLRRQGYLVDHNGAAIPEIKGESRFSRFNQGYQLSTQASLTAGNGPCLIWNGTRPEIILTQPEHVKEFYSRKAKEHLKPTNACMGHYFGRVMGQCAGVVNDDLWRSIRTVFDPHFSHQCAKAFLDPMRRELSRWRDQLPAVPGRADFVVEALEACRILPFKIIALSLYRDVLTDEMFDELLQLNVVHDKVLLTTWFGRRERSSFYNMLPTMAKNNMGTFEVEWEAYNLKVVRIATEKCIACPVKDMYEQVKAGTIGTANWLHTIDEILFANLDTELREEVLAQRQEANGSATSSDDVYERYLQRSDTLLEYTCMESTRLCPTVWFTLPEYATEDLWIGGYHIKAGTCFIIDWARLNTESPVYFPPPAFRDLSPLDYRWSMLRFGFGARKCIGKNFVVLIMKGFLLKVIAEYRLEIDGPSPTSGGWGATNVELRDDRFTVMPRQNVRFYSLAGQM
ncbi:cytochrome P450, partial [Apiospora hydei]